MGSGELARCWQKPACGNLKFNVDGAWVSRSDGLVEAGAGIVVRDSNGSFVVAHSLNLGVVGSSLCAEAMAWRAAFDFVVLLGLDQLVMEGDSQQLVRCIRGLPPINVFILEDLTPLDRKNEKPNLPLGNTP
ncbi:hypothetical protein RHGRI_013724 [Rhododendron griersonianum]|uniref:RNase H type-1 domain-containing protein n=1 Tax=Rhododendron griersonianum TaxID=479676 RepID=A0AAV6K750_9ERIC|nr:hypothetical protein RHGRI_013724 [Rhododendron griersonianum]